MLLAAVAAIAASNVTLMPAAAPKVVVSRESAAFRTTGKKKAQWKAERGIR